MNLRTPCTMLMTAVLSCAALPAAPQAFAPCTGHVVDNTGHNAPNLQVRLRPPQNSTLAAQIALTDANGNFSFPRVQGGQYLLEVSQGPYLLYRQQVSLPTGPLPITIQRH